jgi:thiol-disulfide isomerase/thioredoxin
MTKPILEKLAAEYAGRVNFLSINTDESKALLNDLKIYGIPTVLAARGGKEMSRIVGAQTEENYRVMFEALATDGDINIPMAPLSRFLRLGAGALLIVIGLSTGAWLIAGIGGLVAFLGIYDRCPIWHAITGLFKTI